MKSGESTFRPSIRSYPIEELEEMSLRPPARPPLQRLFTKEQIQAEISRRDEISWKKQDRSRYPELQQGFH